MSQTFLVIDSTTKNILAICFTREQAEETRTNFIIRDLKDAYQQLQSLPHNSEALQLLVYLLDDISKVNTLPFKFNEYHSLNRYYIYTPNPNIHSEIPLTLKSNF
jgi:hypothetical protein